MHKMLLGIEHLMTGVQLRVDVPNPDYQETLQFQQESPSVVRVICAEKFNAYWPLLIPNTKEVILITQS